MGAGFWAGFGEEFSDTVQANRKRIEKTAEDRKQYLNTYGARAISDARKDVSQLKGYISYLSSRGISSKAIQGVFERQGVTGLKTFYSRIEDRDDLTSEDLQETIRIAENYASNTSMDPVQVLTEAVGLVPSGQKGEQREGGIIRSILGLSTQSLSNVMNEPMIGGLTGRDVYAAIGKSGAGYEGTGQAVNYNLPVKALDYTQVKDVAKTLYDQADRRIEDFRTLLVESQNVDASAAPSELAIQARKRLKEQYGTSSTGETYDYTNPEVVMERRLFADGLQQSQDKNRILQGWSLFDAAIFRTALDEETNRKGSITSSSPLGQFRNIYDDFFKGKYQNQSPVKAFATNEDLEAADLPSGWYLVGGILKYAVNVSD